MATKLMLSPILLPVSSRIDTYFNKNIDMDRVCSSYHFFSVCGELGQRFRVNAALWPAGQRLIKPRASPDKSQRNEQTLEHSAPLSPTFSAPADPLPSGGQRWQRRCCWTHSQNT